MATASASVWPSAREGGGGEEGGGGQDIPGENPGIADAGGVGPQRLAHVPHDVGGGPPGGAPLLHPGQSTHLRQGGGVVGRPLALDGGGRLRVRETTQSLLREQVWGYLGDVGGATQSWVLSTHQSLPGAVSWHLQASSHRMSPRYCCAVPMAREGL